jgi:hypothetical protein
MIYVLGVLFAFFVIFLVLAVVLGTEYSFHRTFTKERVKRELITSRPATFTDVDAGFVTRKWVKLHDSLFVADNCLVDSSYMGNWVIQIQDECFVLGFFDYLKYREFLKSEQVQCLKRPSYARKIVSNEEEQ